MSKKLYMLVAIIMAIALVLSACVKSMTGASATTPTAKWKNTPAATGEGTATATEDPIRMLYAYATQTAMAGGGQTPAPGGTETTPQDGSPTVDPTLPSPTLHIIVSPITPTRPATYTLQAGEWVYCIARRFDVHPDELLLLNNVTNPNLVQPGLELKIPQSGNPFPGPRVLIPHPATYTVQSGDTIYRIACNYGDVYPEVIAQANGLQPPYTLTTGATLQIP